MKLEVIILAAGQGTRMRSYLPKVLHPLASRPLLAHVLDSARALMPVRIHVVIGHGSEKVRDALDAEDIVWVMQEEQLGTGHAVLQAIPGVDSDSTVLVLYGDVPLLRSSTLEDLVNNAPALLTAELEDPDGYGRVLRDSKDQLQGVVEHKDATEEQRAISEINTGVLAYPAKLLADYLPRVGNANAQDEYYLPDVLSMAVNEGHRIAALRANEPSEVMGINDRVQLAEAETVYRRRAAEALMIGGVSLADPARIDVRGSMLCECDVFIDVNCVFEGKVTLGEGVRIGANCVLRNCSIAAGSEIHPMSHVDESEVGRDCSVGPYARLRPGTVLADGARIGNFVETKKAIIGQGSKVNHLSYIGDAELGAGVNVGAGTITCNYDGVNKHKTFLGDGVFVGSNSTLVAPLGIGAGGFVAAGSTVTRDVPDSALGVARAKQRNIDGWQTPKQRVEHDKNPSRRD
ncbi:MAG: bifunctional UDP-N-acetylglucosamine pyrophosphorylase/glucosamine-1-phosphate N-acetyltransferase [Glaciecola sp.]|jgi:bifunctional UDP-N-acetylglucosamine pyrophosphorylase/glucosamine-1-phosphate N-acetyltransferase|uniref:bifunctional UDP-N-acetylglucosamine diphosphorylase/glucosamine-1-phosphate N-acetyltransferase GlmU n=1 Tax=Congregibacter sp. TaxID=2744308 RepID=UPI0039E6500D